MPRNLNKIVCHEFGLCLNTEGTVQYYQVPVRIFGWLTEYTKWQPFHHDGEISPAWWFWGVYHQCTPTPFHPNYRHVQSCGVRSSWEGRYTPPISTLPLYVLCGLTHQGGILCSSLTSLPCFRRALWQRSWWRRRGAWASPPPRSSPTWRPPSAARSATASR